MRVTYRDNIFIATGTFQEAKALKKAGFFFHPDPMLCKYGPSICPACRAKPPLKNLWWTKRRESAVRLAAYGDDKVKQALAAHMRAVEMSKATDANIEVPTPPGINYFPYQRAGIAFMSNLREGVKGVLLGDAMGLGKTGQFLGLANYDKNVKSMLIVCPAALRINWMREARKWLVKDERRWNIHIVDADEAVPDDANIVIANYQRVTVGFKACKHCGGEKKKQFPCTTCNGTGDRPHEKNTLCDSCKGRKYQYCTECKGRGKFRSHNLRVFNSIMARKFDLAAFDEAHFIKNPNAARCKAVIGSPGMPGLVDCASKRVFLTGTPLPNRPIEMWPLLSVCVPSEFGNLKVFAKRYCDAHVEYVGESKKVWKANGSSNLEELQERMRSTCLVRRLKEDVLKDLPPKIRQIVPLMPTEKAKKLIAEELEIWDSKFGADREMVQESLASAVEKKDKTAYSQAVAKLEYIQKIAFAEMAKIRHDIAIAKLPSVIEHLHGMLNEGVGKIVCFAHHIEVIETIAKEFKGHAVALYGKTKASGGANSQRQKAIDGFQTNPKIKLFIGGIMAAGTGLTLTASSHVAFAELDWTPSNITQCEDRCHRIGQVNSVLVQQLVLDGSLDARMAHLLIEKQSIADKALDQNTDVEVGGILVARPEAPVAPVPGWKKILLKTAMKTLAKRRDPKTVGGHGFSEFDSTVGQKLATFEGSYSDRQAHLAIKLAQRYRRQLPMDLQKDIGIYEEPSPAERRKMELEAKRAASKNHQSILDFTLDRKRAS